MTDETYDDVQEIDQETIEVSMDQAKQALGLKKALVKLTKNREFKKVVLDNYFETEAARLVMLKADPELQSPEAQADLVKRMDAIGMFREYCRGIMAFGAQAEKELRDLEEAREEMLAEEGED